jgi:aminopeptidase
MGAFKEMAAMSDVRVSKLATLLVRFSRNVRPGQTVLISGGVAAESLIVEVGREVLRCGGHPMYRMLPDCAGEIFYAEAGEEQLKFLPKSGLATAREADHIVNILSETNTQALASVDPKKQRMAEKARRPMMEIMLGKNEWVLTLFPTAAYAQDAGMGLEEFEAFAYAAMRVDKKDPVAEWKKSRDFQAKVLNRLKGADKVRIVGPDTDLTMSVKGRTFISSFGSHNMPDGEIFTGPVETSAEGRIRYTYPVCKSGKEVIDVRLEFEKGKVVKATAAKNEEFLKTMLSSDPGAVRLGELGIGTNYGIQQFIKNILFDEKIGGSIHLALGRSYAETGGRNESAIHWDMICDLRRGGRIEVDGKILQADGKFRV